MLKEEMRRVLESLEWKSRWWKVRSESRDDVGKDVREGLKAYALRQSSIQLALAEKFRELWKSPLDDLVGDPVGVPKGVPTEGDAGRANEEDDEDEGDGEDGGEAGGYDDEDDENP